MSLTPAEGLHASPLASLLCRIGETATRAHIPVYLVGGAVRDLLLGRAMTELDFVTVGSGSGIRLARILAGELGGRTVHVYPKFGTAALRVSSPDSCNPLLLEFVGARKESYRRDSRKPIVEEGTLMDDLRRRDFTVNAMAASLVPGRFGEIVDPFDGTADLREGVLRTPIAPVETFEDDPLRIVRAARFAAQLGFRVDERTLRAMKETAGRVDMLSRERITDELQKMICASRPSIGFRILFDMGILKRILPELTDLYGVQTVAGQRHKDNFLHTLQVLDNLSAMTEGRPCDETRYLRWAALLHDVGKPRTKRFSTSSGWTFHGHEDVGSRMIPKIFGKLRLPSDERMKYVQKLIHLHHRPVALVDEEVTDSAVRRLLFEAGEDVDDLMTLVRADITSRNPRRVQRYLQAFDRVERKMQDVEEKDRLRNFRPPLDGHEIMEVLGVGESVSVGIVKEAVLKAILEGDIPNEYDAARALMMQIKDEAIRRGRLFDEFIAQLRGPERAAMGVVKEVVFTGDIPEDYDDACRYLTRIKEEALQPRTSGGRPA